MTTVSLSREAFESLQIDEGIVALAKQRRQLQLEIDALNQQIKRKQWEITSISSTIFALELSRKN